MTRKKLISIGAISILFLLCAGFLIYILLNRPSTDTTAVSSTQPLNLDTVSEESHTQISSVSAKIMVSSDDEYLYKASKEGKDAAIEFIIQAQNNQGALFPEGIEKEMEEVRSETDSYGTITLKEPTSHYYFEQNINDIPVYGSTIAIHIRNGREIYAADGKTLIDTSVQPATLTRKQAEERAVIVMKSEYPEIASVSAQFVTEYMYNGQLTGLNEDPLTYPAAAIRITSNSLEQPFSMVYVISRTDGAVLTREEEIHEALQREVRDYTQCSNPQDMLSCKVVRKENDPPTGNAESDRIYDLVGQIHAYYLKTFNRDSYDGKGGVISIIPNFSMIMASTGKATTDCRNAFWYNQGHTMAICQNMGAPDVIMHEFTHGVTMYKMSTKLIAQTGSINESVSDIMATALDPDWTIGEDTPLGVLRYMDNPPQKGQPDRMYSPNFQCSANPGEQCSSANGNCWVHQNNGVLNKAFYLMSQGGSFNGCTLKAIGADKARAIVYHATTRYLNPTSNYNEFGSALITACKDLYDTATCEQVKQVIQATEMDQQPYGRQQGVRCMSGVTRKEPACAGASEGTPQPTTAQPSTAPGTSPTGAAPTATASRVPTQGGSQPQSPCVPKYKPDARGCEQPTLLAPASRVGQGEVAFSWCTSTPQQGFYFRLDYNADNDKKPEVTKDRITSSSVSVTVPLGTHAWWVHSFCADRKNGYLSTPSGAKVTVVRSSEVKPTVKQSTGGQNGSQRAPTVIKRTGMPTQAPGGSQQRFLQIN